MATGLISDLKKENSQQLICNFWNYTVVGVSRDQYIMAVENGGTIEWQCNKCQQKQHLTAISNSSIQLPVGESTRLSYLSPAPHPSQQVGKQPQRQSCCHHRRLHYVRVSRLARGDAPQLSWRGRMNCRHCCQLMLRRRIHHFALTCQLAIVVPWRKIYLRSRC